MKVFYPFLYLYIGFASVTSGQDLPPETIVRLNAPATTSLLIREWLNAYKKIRSEVTFEFVSDTESFDLKFYEANESKVLTDFAVCRLPYLKVRSVSKTDVLTPVNKVYDLKSRKIKESGLVSGKDGTGIYADNLDDLIRGIEKGEITLPGLEKIFLHLGSDKNTAAVQFTQWIVQSGHRQAHRLGYALPENATSIAQRKRIDELLKPISTPSCDGLPELMKERKSKAGGAKN